MNLNRELLKSESWDWGHSLLWWGIISIKSCPGISQQMFNIPAVCHYELLPAPFLNVSSYSNILSECCRCEESINSYFCCSQEASSVNLPICCKCLSSIFRANDWIHIHKHKTPSAALYELASGVWYHHVFLRHQLLFLWEICIVSMKMGFWEICFGDF